MGVQVPSSAPNETRKAKALRVFLFAYKKFSKGVAFYCTVRYTVIHNSITVETKEGEHGLKLIISNVSGIPIYEQIKQQVKAAILSGELKEGEALPSLRTLAKELRISVLTVTRAYTELEQEGFVNTIQGRGCFVMGWGSELMKEQLIRKVETGLSEAIQAAKIANLSKEELHHLLDILLEANSDD